MMYVVYCINAFRAEYELSTVGNYPVCIKEMHQCRIFLSSQISPSPGFEDEEFEMAKLHFMILLRIAFILWILRKSLEVVLPLIALNSPKNNMTQIEQELATHTFHSAAFHRAPENTEEEFNQEITLTNNSFGPLNDDKNQGS
ncbi:hypothetical protein ACS0TY_019849 [Phlomoides rotata]